MKKYFLFSTLLFLVFSVIAVACIKEPAVTEPAQVDQSTTAEVIERGKCDGYAIDLVNGMGITICGVREGCLTQCNMCYGAATGNMFINDSNNPVHLPLAGSCFGLANTTTETKVFTLSFPTSNCQSPITVTLGPLQGATYCFEFDPVCNCAVKLNPCGKI